MAEGLHQRQELLANLTQIVVPVKAAEVGLAAALNAEQVHQIQCLANQIQTAEPVRVVAAERAAVRNVELLLQSTRR